MHPFPHDFRYGLRMLRKKLGLTIDPNPYQKTEPTARTGLDPAVEVRPGSLFYIF